MTTNTHPISIKQALFLYVVVSLFLFYEMTLQVAPSVMAGDLTRILNINAFALGIMSSCYFYSYAFMQVPSGILFDRYAPRHIICFALLACVIGNTLMLIFPNFYVACLSRLLIGFGSAFAFVAVLVISNDLFPSKWFATLTGVGQMLGSLGAVNGQWPISLLLSWLGWQGTMTLFSALGVLLMIITWTLLRYEKTYHNSSNSLVQQIGFLKLIVKQSQTWITAAYALLMWAPIAGFASLWGITFLTHVDGVSDHLAAFLCSLMWLGAAAASPLWGYFAAKLGSYRMALIIAALLGIIAFAAITLMKLPLYLLILALFLAGAACAAQALTFTLVRENNVPKVVASSIGFNNMAVVVSGALFQPLIGWFIAHGVTNNMLNNMKIAVLPVLFAYILAFVIGVVFIPKPRQNAIF